MSGVSLDTPLAEALSNVVQNKITEIGWAQDDDTSLAEYIVLMLANGKTQDQIASELAGDLLQDSEGIPEFAQWLFEQVNTLKDGGQSDTRAPTATQAQQPVPASSDQNAAPDPMQDMTSEEIPAAYDADMMGDAAPDNAPKGPKGMHGGRPAGRGGRMMNQLNKTMDRTSDSVLHRVRGQGGTERINSHGRGTPRGPRSLQNRDVRPGMQKALNGMGMTGQNPSMMQNGAPSPIMPMNPQDQMAFMAAMMEQQAQMMAQFMPGMMQQGGGNAAFGQQQPSSQGRSLFDRVETPGRGRGRGRGRGGQQNGISRNSVSKGADGDSAMSTDEPSSSMEVESSQQANGGEPFKTMCRFNLRCTNKECHFAHQSPAAPPNTTVDMNDTCSFGAACKNVKCAGRHPSPAGIKAFQADQQCKFWPNCTNPNCTFTHPTMPLCRNGADCKVEHCKFTHLQTPCKFNPCLNPRCPFKHSEGQRGNYADKVWTADGTEKQGDDHVSERKFATDEGEEELIKPDPEAQAVEEVIT